MLPELLNQIPDGQPIGKVGADGACDTPGCHAAIAARSACAVIPARKNARPWLEKTPGAQARNDTVRATRRLGRTIRGIVFPAIGCGASSCWVSASWRATLTGRWPNCKSGRSPVLSDQWRSPAHSMNRFTALETPQTQRMRSVCPREGVTRPQAELCNKASSRDT